MSDRKDVPVYLFTGFLESGKTKFIQETLEDKRFCNGERTMLLVCEEGEEEYAPDQFADKSVYIHVIENQSELTAENLEKWLRESRAERVVVEYNGMWMLDVLYSAMPESWMVYQEVMFADAGTFLTYNNNMRQLVYDKLKSCELVVFNRFKPDMDKMEFHKIVRGASRRSDIAYEYAGGKVEYDDIEDPLPFDLTAPVVEIGDDDYAAWYRDLSEEPKKYEGKTVRFKCRALKRKKIPAGCFIVGRHVMTCCAEDVQFAGLLCVWKKAGALTTGMWATVTAQIKIEHNKAYKGEGPVLYVTDFSLAKAPEEELVTFS